MFCEKCGTQVPENAKFCPGCGADPNAPADAAPNTGTTPNTGAPAGGTKMPEFLNTPDTTDKFDPADISANKGLCVLAYFGILFFIPLVAKPESKFSRFHANQGLVFLIANIAAQIARTVLNLIINTILSGVLSLYTISGLVTGLISLAVSAATLALMIMGIVNTINGKAKELPLIGRFHLIDKEQ